MTSSKKILLFTNSEYGQANVFLSVAYELAMRNVQVHIASFPPFGKRLLNLEPLLKDYSQDIIFHTVPGLNYEDALTRFVDFKQLCTPPGVNGALQSYAVVPHAISPWTVEEYHQQMISLENIVEAVNPDGVAIDSLWNTALDVSKKLGLKRVILSPNSPKDFIGMKQPWLGGFWKYPALSSGYLYPIPISLIPSNIYLNIRLIFTLVTSPLMKSLDAIRRTSHGLSNAIIDQFTPDIPIIFPALPETEFPDIQIPSNVHLSGPILLPWKSVQECDPDLEEWLSQPEMKTIMINLGSHALSDAIQIREIGGGIRILLGTMKNVQVLWKLMPDGEIRSVLEEIVGGEKRVKIVNWLEADPYAVLVHPNVVCSVHHGGANSFFEAVSAGVPHVVLPKWYDTYDYASRAEYLGIGLFGNQTSAPGASAEEFGNALVRVVKEKSFVENAKILAQKCGSGESGRAKAAEKLLELFNQ
ncbi:hypothetical protein D9757_010159 [Collybiopsis confluens]|uniref:UDP-glucoronosyl and UDP-glucosyl transferase family protein n=1 Tax=Collybiopsis confluens TaxID=2823264 RepID=A0A8H5LYD0_9AGAR|nr:hypothetical protein D9757_010159 [Collybiopsis confluens]